MALRHYLGVLLLVGGLQPSVASDDTLTLSDAIAKTVADNPELVRNDLRRRAADARIERAGQAPATRLGLELENFAGTGDTARLSGADATLSLSRTLERGAKAARRAAVARGERALVATEADIDRLNLLARVARRFVHVVRDQALLEVAEEAVILAREAHADARRRVEAGQAPASEAGRADIALADAELALEHAEHELKSTRVGLASLWGAEHPGFDRAVAELDALPEAEPLDRLMDAFDRNPQQRRLAESRRVAEARQRLARARQVTDVTVSAGVRHRAATDDNAFVLGLSVPLGSAERARPGVAAAEAEHAASAQARLAARRELYSVVYARYQEMGHARTEVETLRRRILPSAREVLADIRAGYNRGRYGYLELAEARRELIAHRRRAIDAAARYHRHLIEIERLTGTPATAFSEDLQP